MLTANAHAIRFFVTTPLLLMLSCTRAQETYPVPPQRVPIADTAPSETGAFVRMNDPNAESHIVRDISSVIEGAGWRWTNAQPELRFRLGLANTLEDVRFTAHIGLVEATLRETGPVTVSVFVNGRRLGSQRCAEPGDHRINLPVPAGLLTPQSAANVLMQADKLYTAKDDGVRLGFVLYEAGFVQ